MEDKEKKIAIVRRFFENTLCEDSVEKSCEFLSPNLTLHGPDWGRTELGRERIVDIDKGLAKAFKRKSYRICDIYAHDAKVVAEWEMTVIHHGDLTVLTNTPIPATNEEVTINGMSIYRFQDDQVVEIWQGWDLKGMVLHLRQAAELDSFDFLATEKKEYYLEGAPKLSGQERSCLRQLLIGNTAQETADSLVLSSRTVETYLEGARTN